MTLLDQKRWKLAWARLEAFRNNIPTWIDQEDVNHYHSIVDSLEVASGESLEVFCISNTRMRPLPTIYLTNRARIHDLRRNRAKQNQKEFCDSEYFVSQVEGLWRYLDDLVFASSQIKSPAPTNVLHIGTMIQSSIQQATQGSAISQYHQLDDVKLTKQQIHLFVLDAIGTTSCLDPANVTEERLPLSTIDRRIKNAQKQDPERAIQCGIPSLNDPCRSDKIKQLLSQMARERYLKYYPPDKWSLL